MANFRIPTKKILSEQNISKIIMLGIGLRDELSNMELGLISDYDITKTYTRGQAVYYNNYLYKCLYTTTGDFDESKWQLIGDDLDLVTKADIEAMLGLTQEELDTLQNILNDSQITLSTTFSSSKIFSDMQDILSQSKTFTLDQFAKASKASYQVVSSTSEMTDKSVIYLLPNSSNYDMYIVETDGTAQKIGDTTIDLSQFYTKTEIDNDFVKKTDADGKYALITTVDKKSEKTDLDNHINDTVAHMTQSEKDSYVKKTSITDTIDSTSTSTDIASALSVYNYAIKDKRLKTYSINTNEDFPNAKTLKDISNNLPSNSIAIIDSSYDSTSFFGLPNNKFVIVWIRRYSGRDSIMAYTTTGSNIYNCNNVTNQTWTKICNTSVDDVDKTDITLPKISGLNVTVGELWYTVKNGWCNVNFYLGASSSTYLDWTEITTELPKPYALVTDCLKSDFSSSPNILLQIIGGKLKITCSEAIPKNTTYYCNISYPVAES
jgi:hypothetical protein